MSDSLSGGEASSCSWVASGLTARLLLTVMLLVPTVAVAQRDYSKV